MKAIITTTLPVFFLLLLSACTSDTDPAPEPETTGAHIFIVGGHASHDFDTWFKDEDIKTLEEAGFTASYTDKPEDIRSSLGNADILSLTNNQPIPSPNTRKAIFNHVDSGKGLLLIHAGLWYNWPDWPEYNKELAAGGSRSHGPYGAFEIKVVQPEHPIVQGLPLSFTLEDELYRYEVDSEIVQIDTLAIGIEPDTGVEYPVIWVVEDPKRNIVGITLGHDGFTHQSVAYKQLLANSVNWLKNQE